MTRTGSCLCGAVCYEVHGPLGDVSACHCSQCRKQSGHHYASVDVAEADLRVQGNETLRWYAASPQAKRGFCSTCGSALFWKENGAKTTSILLGSMDSPTGLTLNRHIFAGDKGDYYSLPEDHEAWVASAKSDSFPANG